MQALIEQLINEAIQPTHLEVIDESHMHSVPKGAQTHFKVIIVSEQFQGNPLIKRHRRINELLKPAFEKGLHALALHTMTGEEWQKKGGAAPESPPCHGGSKQ